MNKNYEDTVADAILDVFRKYPYISLAELLREQPEGTVSLSAQMRDEIGAAAIRAVAQWNLNYAVERQR